jgi:Domain of unknown function (DUF4382)
MEVGMITSAYPVRRETTSLLNYKYLSISGIVLVLAACGGGGGSSGGGGSTAAPGTVSFALSDAPVEGLSEVVITIDAMELRRKDSGDCDDDPGTDDCVFIDQFTEDGEDTDTIQVDLLSLQDGNNIIIVEGLELEAGEYDQLKLSVNDEDTNFSWVKEIDNGDVLKELKVPSEELKLGGFTVESGGVQVFVIEFDLRKAMTYNPGPDRYILKPTGVRIVDVEAAASIFGTVDSGLFSGINSVPCIEKEDVTDGNVIYLYKGHSLAAANLTDSFDSGLDADAPDTAIAPYTSQKVAADGSYGIYSLPAGNYTLAFSCQAEIDDPDFREGIVIPSPETEIVELSLGEGESKSCNLPLVGGDC